MWLTPTKPKGIRSLCDPGWMICRTLLRTSKSRSSLSEMMAVSSRRPRKSQSDLEADLELPRYAGSPRKSPVWRFDLIVLGPENQPIPDKREAAEPSEEDIRRAMGDVERMLQAGFVQQALIAAWAVLENCNAQETSGKREEAGWGSSSRTMLNELYSDGVLQSSVFRDLEGLYLARALSFMGSRPELLRTAPCSSSSGLARMLLDESRTCKKDRVTGKRAGPPYEWSGRKSSMLYPLSVPGTKPYQ